MKRLFSVILCCIASFSALAANVVKTEEFKHFNGIYVQDEIVVRVHQGSGYHVKLETDERVVDFCKIYLSGGVLTADVDKANFPKELKAQLRQKGNEVSYTLEITIPENAGLESITLKENSKLFADAAVSLSGKCTVDLTDNAYAKFSRLSCDQFTVRTNKKSSINGHFVAPNFNASASNSSVMDYSVECTKAELEADGSSKSQLDIRAEKAYITYSGFSKLSYKGHITELNISGKGASELDAYSLEAENVLVSLANCTCKVHALKALDMNLSNGAKLEYDGEPVLSIKKISVSSVTRRQDAKKN